MFETKKKYWYDRIQRKLLKHEYERKEKKM